MTSRASNPVAGPQVLNMLAVATHSALAERVFVQLRSDILHARLRP